MRGNIHLHKYWSTDVLYGTPQFRKCMPRDEWCHWKSTMHFVDINEGLPRDHHDYCAAWKVHKFLDMCSTIWRANMHMPQYAAGQLLCATHELSTMWLLLR